MRTPSPSCSTVVAQLGAVVLGDAVAGELQRRAHLGGAIESSAAAISVGGTRSSSSVARRRSAR